MTLCGETAGWGLWIIEFVFIYGWDVNRSDDREQRLVGCIGWGVSLVQLSQHPATHCEILDACPCSLFLPFTLSDYSDIDSCIGSSSAAKWHSRLLCWVNVNVEMLMVASFLESTNSSFVLFSLFALFSKSSPWLVTESMNCNKTFTEFALCCVLSNHCFIGPMAKKITAL